MLPVAASSLLIGGFFPTRIDSAARHQHLGRLRTAIELADPAYRSILLAIAAALVLQSVWALVWGNAGLGAVAAGLSRFRAVPARPYYQPPAPHAARGPATR